MNNKVEDEKSSMTEKIILIIMLSLFSVVGSVGNGMVIFVFQRIRDKSTAQIFIITMAVIDLFTCMVIIPFTMVVEYTDFKIKYDFFCKLYHFFITSKVPLSAFIMVAIAFDRYFCICHPLKRIMTVRRVKVIIMFLSFLACTLGVITSLFYSVYHYVERIDTERIDSLLGTNFTAQSRANLDKLNVVKSRSDDGKGTSVENYYTERERIINAISEHNATFNGSFPMVFEVVDVGTCDPSAVIVGTALLEAYRPIHIAVWPVCLITVVILYMIIYRFMCLRRSKKLRQKLLMCSYVSRDGMYENTRLVSGEGDKKKTNCKKSNISTSSIVGSVPTSISGYEIGSSSIVLKTTSSCQNAETLLLPEPNSDFEKHGHNLLVETAPKNKISFSPIPIATAVTPTDHDDNTPILNNFYTQSGSNNNNDPLSGDRGQGGRRHSHLPEQKYHWHKNRDSMKRYKGKTKRRKSQHSFETEKLWEENRSANAKTALMLFTVTIVFVIAFVPAMLMAQRLVSFNLVVFYTYFIYNVANPFIYAFMNHIFKEYMRKMLMCKDASGTPKRAHLTVLAL
ncbi:orexin receptor type 2 [Biomphalaria pfeifferi]|uniref:Orexin receptor type 2 n=1 Tax=Biomphalaria pfeifferi TaxID=112525 RepID=A0AAD8FG23_BIOPF|nr:orexin receptor type 2 [Biomphalaria pfeifferi]